MSNKNKIKRELEIRTRKNMPPKWKKSFKYSVQKHMENDGWTVFPICASDIPLELLCMRMLSHHVERTGIRVKPHGHIYDDERKTLIEFGKKLNMRILYVSEVAGHEFKFVTLYRGHEKFINKKSNKNFLFEKI